MSARFCPNCSNVLSIYTTGWDYGQKLMRHYECECGYHQIQPEENRVWPQSDMDRFYRIKKHLMLAKELLLKDDKDFAESD